MSWPTIGEVADRDVIVLEAIRCIHNGESGSALFESWRS